MRYVNTLSIRHASQMYCNNVTFSPQKAWRRVWEWSNSATFS